MKRQSGITLVALIITIIVMLILAGIVIVTGAMPGGIIDRAQAAMIENERAEVEDIVMGSYVYKALASMNTVGQLDLEKTAQTIYNNLTGNGYTVKTMAGAEAGSYEEIFPEGATSISLNVEGKRGTYEGIVKKDGLQDGMKIAEENGNDEPGTVPPPSEEIDLSVVGYFYNTMYNAEQPEIVYADASYYGYYDDENNDKISDKNTSLSAYTSGYDLNIPVSFLTEIVPTEGDIQVTITHYDGREENITLKQSIDNNRKWEYASRILTGKEDDVVWEEYIAMEFYSYTQNTNSFPYNKESSEYHYLSIDAGNAVPFHKLTILGKTIEFPFNCQAHIGWEDEWFETINPLYTNILNVSNVVVNFSDGSSKSYNSRNIYDANLYYSDDSCFYYSSQDIPVLYKDGAFIINMPDTNFKKSITSITVVENGVAKKFNITSDTQIITSNAWN